MSPFGHRRLFWGMALLVVVALGGEAGWLVASRRAAQEAELGLARRNQERRSLAERTPAPTMARAAAIEEDLAQATAALRAVAGRLWRRAVPAGPPPASRTEAFFDLSGFVRAIGEQAARAGVGLKDGERFGFSAYVHDGPPSALIPAVDRQRRIAAALLEALIAARPHRIEAVQRENPEAGAAMPVRGGAGDPAETGDFFVADPRLSLRAPGAVETAAFRLVFTGDSGALRRLLNRLAAFDGPAVVRSVTVDPVGEAWPRPPGRPGPGESLALVLRAARSRFCVMVECCEVRGLAPLPGAPDHPPADDAGRGDTWPAPAAQPRGGQWVYDLFTPPSVYFDSRGGALHAAAEPGAAEPAEAPPDLELLEVRPGPFRLQLIGYAGRPDDLRGVFADTASGETMVASQGERLPIAGVSIRRLALDQRGPQTAGDGADRDPVAIAVVVEDGGGREVELTTRGLCRAGAPVGSFASRRTAARAAEAAAGGSFVLDGISYWVEQIDLQPPQATVAWSPAGGAGPPIRRLIRPRDPTRGETAPDRCATNQGGTAIGISP